MTLDNIALEAHHLKKSYKRGAEEILAIDDVSLTIQKGEFMSFIGPSGSGKTTLINILGCLDNATSGSLKIGGRTVFADNQGLSETELTKIRRRVFGYIFQKFYLIPTLNVYENVLLPFAFFQKPEANADPMEILKFLGLDKRIHHRPSELSGGEMQRVAIARALVNKPEILLADEPTGNLDTKRSEEIGEVLKTLNEKEGLTVLLVTHNPMLAKFAGRTITLRDG
ncbi:MAG: ABC transporter ATP-binding protein, partial [Candidatus Aminicenantes bacterium]|nr:ABC transporter ATP-binding protein [Candidatus Aminicenantes bacterium]